MYTIERPSISRIIDLGPLRAIGAYSKAFLLYLQVHRNVVKCFLHSHGMATLTRFFCKNANIILQIENSWNSKTDFFLNVYLQIFLVK